jgi:tRNA threonylcarbamoyladenosine biosynthesis protein TsaE
MSVASVDLVDAAATEAVGAKLATGLAGGMVITLSGDLGTGKTTLVRGVLRALGWSDAVKSPTYTLVEYYPFSSLYFYHFDFYRFADPEEWETAGLAECFRDDSVCAIEWPERVPGRLPEADVALTFSLPTDPHAPGRRLAIDARTTAGERCLSAMTATAPQRAGSR